MVTVLVVGGGAGRGRPCDAKCYNGKPGGVCRCVCGGRNHGQGLAKVNGQTVFSFMDVVGLDPEAEFEAAKRKTAKLVASLRLFHRCEKKKVVLSTVESLEEWYKEQLNLK